MARTPSLWNSPRIFWIALCLVALAVGCREKDRGHSDKLVNQGALAQVKSIADLRHLLVPGMRTNEIVAAIGNPGWTLNEAESGSLWGYALPPFPADDQMQGTYVIGVTITITNGCLAWWGCAYTEDVGKPSVSVVREETLGKKAEESTPLGLRFYVVSMDPDPELKFVDTEQFPKLGYIPSTPSLVINQVREVTLIERKASNEADPIWSFRISFLPEDATSLKLITATNIGEQLLITVGDEPVVAPRIVSASETGVVEIECSERARMESVKQRLANVKLGRY